MKKEWMKDAFDVAEKAQGENTVQIMNVYMAMFRCLNDQLEELKKLSVVLGEKAESWKNANTADNYNAFYTSLKTYVDDRIQEID